MTTTRQTLLCGLLALACAASGTAFAQRRDNDRRDDHRDDRGRQEQRNDQRNDHYRAWDYKRGVGPDNRFHKGDRLPAQYRGHNYVVNDWRGHHLSAPPRGYQWVQSGGDYLLVAVATGIIVNALLNN